MAGLVGQLKEFNFKNSSWQIYSARLKNYFIANKIENEGEKRAIFLNILDEESYKLMFDLCAPTIPESNVFTDLLKNLTINSCQYNRTSQQE